jgi:hypothetical protein
VGDSVVGEAVGPRLGSREATGPPDPPPHPASTRANVAPLTPATMRLVARPERSIGPPPGRAWRPAAPRTGPPAESRLAVLGTVPDHPLRMSQRPRGVTAAARTS